MTFPNLRYDPDWETVHVHHAGERARAEAERDRLIAADAMTTDAYQRAKAEFDRHHQACLATFKAQHATVQEYATWLFGTFSVDSGDWESGIPVPVVDLAELRTVEEADAAWSRVQRIVSESAAERRLSLPTGQPEGLRAFADPASPTLNRYWREFSPRELYPTGYTGGVGSRTLVTVDEQPDGWHVCFMHDRKTVGVSVTNARRQSRRWRVAGLARLGRRPAAGGTDRAEGGLLERHHGGRQHRPGQRRATAPRPRPQRQLRR